MPPDQAWKLIAHGGAQDISSEAEPANREGMAQAVKAGSRILEMGGSALDAVEEVVKSLEDNPAFNAGLFGCVKNEEGRIELTASIMDGETLEIGAVASIQKFAHPVSIARKLLKERAILLVGAGAEKFAHQQGFTQSEVNKCQPAGALGCDTVGCVARDSHGNLAAATSTGGLNGVRAGRIGDVPLPGCGFYADNTRGAISISGDGEMIARVLLASEFLHLLKSNNPDVSASQALALLDRVNGEAGLIAIDPTGNITWAHNSAHFSVGFASAGNSKPTIYLNKGEEHAEHT